MNFTLLKCYFCDAWKPPQARGSDKSWSWIGSFVVKSTKGTEEGVLLQLGHKYIY